MDPISALGAASSVVGIAGFALDLSVGLFKVASQIRSASDSIKGLGDTVQATAFALEQIEKLLKEEEEHILQSRTLRIFSKTALIRVKETTNRCLKLLWKIEAVAIGSDEPDETELVARLARLASATVKSIQLDPKFTSPSVGPWDRLVFAVSTSDKLKEYGRQLQNYQVSLSLIFDVVTLTYLLSKNSLTDTDQKAIATAKEDLHRPRPNFRRVADSVLHGHDVSESSPPETRSPQTQDCSAATASRGLVDPSGGVGANVVLLHTPSPTPTSMPTMGKKAPRIAFSQFTVSTAAVTGARSLDGPGDGAVSVTGLESASDKAFACQASESAGSSRKSLQFAPGIRGGTSSYFSTVQADSVPDLMKVYTLQRHREWREEKLTYAEILQRLAKLDQESQTALDKKLSLPLGQQSKVDAIQAQANAHEDEKRQYHWNLRQLELIKGKMSRIRGFMTIIVYLQREKSRLQQQKVWGDVHPQRPATRKSRAEHVDDFEDLSPVVGSSMGWAESDQQTCYHCGGHGHNTRDCPQIDAQTSYDTDYYSPRQNFGTLVSEGSIDVRGRRTAARAFESIRDKLGTPGPDAFDDSEFIPGRAADFPAIPAEEQRNTKLPQVAASYDPPRDSDSNATPSLSLEDAEEHRRLLGQVCFSGRGHSMDFNSSSNKEQPDLSLPRLPKRYSYYFEDEAGLQFQENTPRGKILPPARATCLHERAHPLPPYEESRTSTASASPPSSIPDQEDSPAWSKLELRGSPYYFPVSRAVAASQDELLDDAIITQLMSLLTPAGDE